MSGTATALPPTVSLNPREDLSLARLKTEPAVQAFVLLRVGFALAPVLFGLDKFFDALVNWSTYLAPTMNDVIPGDAHQAMLGVGVTEIAAGLLVALRPRIGAYVVAAWLTGIIVNLLLLGDYYDVALRDFGLLIGALALGRLASGGVGSSVR